MLRVKICGITRVADAEAAADAGAQAIGLVFYPGSRRYVDIGMAQEICRALPPFVQTVGLFVNAETSEVRGTLAKVPLNILQFHGSESPEYCRQFAYPWMKAIPAIGSSSVVSRAAAYSGARAVLVDSGSGDHFGGTGKTFDWSVLPQPMPRGMVLAGGLDPDNVGEAVRSLRPSSVDVSSGVEREPGIKDAAKMRQFVANATAAMEEFET